MINQTSILSESVRLSDEFSVNLHYSRDDGVLNVFVKTTPDSQAFPRHINVYNSITTDDDRFENIEDDRLSSLDDDDKINSMSSRDDEDDEPLIYIEVSNVYFYDYYPENETDVCRTSIASSLCSSLSYCDEPCTDNDDGYSTHSMDDIEQTHSSLSLSSCKTIVPLSDKSLFSLNRFDDIFEEIWPLRRLIEQIIFTNPFKQTIRRMMINHFFG